MTFASQVCGDSARHPLRAVLLFAAFLGLWLWHHPYTGIRHDAVLYTVQALNFLHPQNYAGDVYFLFGSQDDYTLFSPLYAALIALIGLGSAALLIAFFGALLWCYAAWRLAGYWSGAARWLFLFFLAVMPIAYGGHEILSAAEPFAVPRLWADALTLLACALWLERKGWQALVAWIPAVLLHPLMALAGASFVFFHELRFTLRWGVAVAASGVAVSALALADAPLLGRLFRVMDPQWFGLVYQRTSYYMFPSAWGLRDYNILLFHSVALLWAAWLTRDDTFRRLLLAAFLTGIVGWLTALFGGDLLHSVLVLQVQPWRTLWLMYVFGWGAAAWLMVELWRPARFAVLGLAAAWFLREYTGGLVLLATCLLYWQRSGLSQTVIRWLEGLLVFSIASYIIWTVWDASTMYLALRPEEEPTPWESLLGWKRALTEQDALLTFAVAALAWGLWRWRQALLPALLIPLVAFAFAEGWDGRSSELKALEAGEMWGKTPFNRVMRQGGIVYWQEGLQPTWFLLASPSYFSLHQSAGLLFSRPLTMELYRRHLQVKPLGGKDAEFRLLSRREAFLHQFSKSYVEPASLEGLRKACADPILDYVILHRRHAPYATAAWFAPYFPGGVYLYDCKVFRAS